MSRATIEKITPPPSGSDQQGSSAAAKGPATNAQPAPNVAPNAPYAQVEFKKPSPPPSTATLLVPSPKVTTAPPTVPSPSIGTSVDLTKTNQVNLVSDNLASARELPAKFEMKPADPAPNLVQKNMSRETADMPQAPVTVVHPVVTVQPGRQATLEDGQVPQVPGGNLEPSVDDKEQHSILTKCMAEFLGVIIYVFIGCMQMQSMNKSSFAHVEPSRNSSTIYPSAEIFHSALAHGLSYVTVFAVFGRISGAHINPAITMGIAIVGKMSIVHAICYLMSQFCGGLVGAFLVRGCLTHESYRDIIGGALYIEDPVQWYQGVVSEILGSVVLTLTFLLTAVDTDKNILAPLAIGLATTIDILSVGNLSGCSMNPARSLGPNVVAAILLKTDLPLRFWSYHWIYYAGPFTGSLIAGSFYRTFFAWDRRMCP